MLVLNEVEYPTVEFVFALLLYHSMWHIINYFNGFYFNALFIYIFSLVLFFVWLYVHINIFLFG